MILRVLRVHSIKSRVTLFTLIIFVVSIWALWFYASRMLQTDMQRLLGEQQLSTAYFIAEDINTELKDRFTAMNAVAALMTPALMRNAQAAQAFLEDRPILVGLFNGGVTIVAVTGVAIADAPRSNQRIGVNYLNIDYVAANLKEGKSAIGKPIMGPTLKTPVVGMGVPIRDAQGKVIGALSGVIRLDKQSFLDKISESSYGKTGGYLLVAPGQRTIITATDKTRIMEQLPPPGASLLLDRLLDGYQGTSIFVNPRGVEVLTSTKAIDIPGWIVSAMISVEEAFSPIDQMQRRLLWATIFFTLMAAALTWLMVRQELAPMLSTVNALKLLSTTDQRPQALPITHKNEIGKLVGGFNQLLKILGERETALRESEERYRTAFQFSREAVNITRLEDGRYLDVNDGFTRLTGWTRDEAIGKTALELKVWPSAHERQRMVDALQRDGFCEDLQLDFLTKDGRVISTLFSAHQMVVHGQECILSVTHDITQRKQTEEAQRIAAVAFESELGMTITNAERTILRINKAFTQITGYTAEDAVGQTPRLLSSGRHDAAFYREMDLRLERDGSWQGEVWNRRKNGEIYPVWLSITVVRDGVGNVTNYVGSHHDITERKSAEDELTKLNQELTQSRGTLRALASQKEVRLERERKHIAREVHDELGQMLTALRMNLSMCVKDHGSRSPGLAAELQDMKKLIDRAIQGVRNVAANLRPVALDMGLVAAIEWIGAEFSRRTSVPCTIVVHPEDIALDETRAVVFFRIVQESLTNIARHAQATQVDIKLDCGDDALRLEVRDNGRGFLVATRGNSKTFGLIGMHERAFALGGTLKINSTPGLGTVVVVLMPLNDHPTENIPHDSTAHS